MEKKLLTEINHMRKIMGLPLIVEAGPWADIIGKVIGTAVQMSDINLMINKVVKTITITEINNILTKVVSPKKTLSGDEIDILKALDNEIKKPKNSLGKTNADGLSGVYKEAANDAFSAADMTKGKLLKRQADKIDVYLKQQKNQGAGSTPGVPPGGAGSLPKIYQTYDDALKSLEIELEKVKSQYPKAFEGRNIGIGRQTIEQAARESVGKTQKEAIDIMNVRFAELEGTLPDAKPWFRNLIKSFDFRVKDATGKYSPSASFQKVLKASATVVAGIFIISALIDFGERVSKLNKEDPEAALWQNMWIAANEMIGVTVSTGVAGGEAAIESGKEDYRRREDEKKPTSDEAPPPPSGGASGGGESGGGASGGGASGGGASGGKASGDDVRPGTPYKPKPI